MSVILIMFVSYVIKSLYKRYVYHTNVYWWNRQLINLKIYCARDSLQLHNVMYMTYTFSLEWSFLFKLYKLSVLKMNMLLCVWSKFKPFNVVFQNKSFFLVYNFFKNVVNYFIIVTVKIRQLRKIFFSLNWFKINGKQNKCHTKVNWYCNK